MGYIKSRAYIKTTQTAQTCACAVLIAMSHAATAQTATQTNKNTNTQTHEQTHIEKSLKAVHVQAQSENAYKPTEKLASPKFTQSVLDTPQTVNVISEEMIKAQGTANLSEALRNTPGITFTTGENGNVTTGDSIFMRGFDTSGSIFVDGIRDLGTFTRDTFNIEQIEVIKGPTGSDNGRGAPSGYVNLVSKTARDENFNLGSVSIGSGNRLRATADLNKTLESAIEGSAFRLNVMSDKGNLVGRDVAKNESLAIAPSLVFGLGTPTRMTFNYLHVNQDHIPDGGLPTVGLPSFSNSFLGENAANAPKVPTNNFYGSPNDFNRVKANMFTAKIEHDLAEGSTIRNISRYAKTDQRLQMTGLIVSNSGSWQIMGDPNDPNTWNIGRLRYGKDQSNELITNQTNFTTSLQTGSIKHQISTGLEFLQEKQNQTAYSASASDRANLYNPNHNDHFGAFTPSGAYNQGSSTTSAIYLFDNLVFNPEWSLNTGLRFEHYKTDFFSKPASNAASQTATQLQKSGNSLTGKLAVVYKPAQNASFYAGIANSEKPPGSDNFNLSASSSNINSPNLKPQKSLHTEVGTKWELLNRQLLLSAAAFNTENKNDLAVADPITGDVRQYGKKRVRGLELSVAGQISPSFQMSSGLAFLNTKVQEGTNTQTGAGLNFTPKLALTSWATYKISSDWSIGGGARYLASQNTKIHNDISRSGITEMPSYWILDAMASYQVNKNISLQLNLQNLANKFYIASTNVNGSASDSGGRYQLGAPRSALLTMNMAF